MPQTYQGPFGSPFVLPDGFQAFNPGGVSASDFYDNPFLYQKYPDMPEYQSAYGDINSRLQGLPGLNRKPLDDLESYANSTGPSPWASAQQALLQQNSNQAQGAAGATSNAATASAMDRLAATGGLSTGARERIGTAGANNLVNAKQGVQGQRITQSGQIAATDAQNKLGILENLPGQEVQALQPEYQKQSIWAQAQMADAQGRNAFNAQNYENQIKQQAGNAQAYAQQHS